MLKFISFTVVFIIAFVANAQNHVTVNLSKNPIETNEPSIAIDPKYPAFQVLGSNTNKFFISEDGGMQWNEKKLNPKEGFYGDPVCKITNKGDIYLLHLAKNPKLKWPQHFDQIVFEGSTDGGATFFSTGIGNNPGKVQDKPWIAVNEIKKNKFYNHIYVTWTEFDSYGSTNPADSSRIKFAYSTDGGHTFSKAITISDKPGNAADGDSTLEGANIAIGKKGELYCVWAGLDKLFLDISYDGGQTWGADREIATIPGSWNIENLSGVSRANSMPFIVSNPKGELIIIYGAYTNGNYHVYSIASRDNALTFTPPVQVDEQNVQYQTDAYMPHITVDSKTGCIYATYYTRRFSNNNVFTDVVLSQYKKGKWLPEYRLTPQSIAPPGPLTFFGDYISIAAARKNIRVAYNYYNQPQNLVTVNIAVLNTKILNTKTRSYFAGVLNTVYRQKEQDVVIHAELPGSKNAIVEVYRNNKLIYKNVYETLPGITIEDIIPKSKLGQGMFEIKVLAGPNQLNTSFFIEK